MEALKPEVEAPPSDRSKVHLQLFDGGLSIEAEALDTAALRATLNSYLYWIGGIMEIMERLSERSLRKRE